MKKPIFHLWANLNSVYFINTKTEFNCSKYIGPINILNRRLKSGRWLENEKTYP